jgi:acetyl esterase
MAVKRPAGDAWDPNLDPASRPISIWRTNSSDEADHGSIEDQRQAYLDLCGAFARPHPAGVKALDRTIKANGIDIPLRIYRPAASGVLPAVLFFHGGGWVLGDLDSHDSITADICGRTNAVVIAVHYRLAPENPFPAAFDDCYAALAHVSAHAADFGVDPARIAICGDSTGGNLAAAVALAARDRKDPRSRPGADLPGLRQRFRSAFLPRECRRAHADARCHVRLLEPLHGR